MLYLTDKGIDITLLALYLDMMICHREGLGGILRSGELTDLSH